jgi:hypothetical protein
MLDVSGFHHRLQNFDLGAQFAKFYVDVLLPFPTPFLVQLGDHIAERFALVFGKKWRLVKKLGDTIVGPPIPSGDYARTNRVWGVAEYFPNYAGILPHVNGKTDLETSYERIREGVTLPPSKGGLYVSVVPHRLASSHTTSMD